MAAKQYIPSSGYSPLVKTHPMPSLGMGIPTSAYNPYPPSFGATTNHTSSLPTYGAGLNGANLYPWGATSNQNTTVGNHSGACDPVRVNTDIAGHYYHANYYDPTVYLNNRYPYGATGTNQDVYQVRPSAQLYNGNSSYSAPGSSYNINQYNSTQLNSGNKHGAIGTSLSAYRSTAPNQPNNGNVYGSSSYQSESKGVNASRITDQNLYEAININFRKLSFRRTPGANRPDGVRKIRRTPGAGRPKAVAQSHEPNNQISETLPSSELLIQSPSAYSRNAVQEPQEVQPAQEEQKGEQAPQLGEPRFHSTAIKAMNMLTRSFFDGPPTAHSHPYLDWLHFQKTDPPPTVVPNEKDFHERMLETREGLSNPIPIYGKDGKYGDPMSLPSSDLRWFGLL